MRTKSHAAAAASQFGTLCTYCGGFAAGLLYQWHPTAALVMAGGAVAVSVLTIVSIGINWMLRNTNVARRARGQR